MISREYARKEKLLMRKIHEVLPVAYASFCITLHREYGFGYGRLINVLMGTQSLFRDHGDGKIDVIKICSDELGIDFLSEQTAKETGIEGKRI